MGLDNKELKWDTETIRLMAKEIGLDLDASYCGFKDAGMCAAKLVDCNSKQYIVCAGLPARIWEEWHDQTKLNYKVKHSEREAVLA